MGIYSVTYDIVSQESAEYGDNEESGFIVEKSDNLTLAKCIDELTSTRTNAVEGVVHVEVCRGWPEHTIVVQNGMEFETGCYETRYLHLPSSVTESSLNRLVKLIKSM